MGYNTDFSGTLRVTPPLNEHEIDYLADFTETRHTSTAHGLLDISVGHRANGNDPQGGKPGIWCNWIADDDGNLVWNESENTYSHDRWLIWLIENLFGPDSRDFVAARLGDDPRLEHFTCNHVISGKVYAQGENPDDMWQIKVVDNDVRVLEASVIYIDEDDAGLAGDLEHPRFADWQYEVANGDTSRSFRDWLAVNGS